MKKTGLILLLLAGTVGLYFLGQPGSPAEKAPAQKAEPSPSPVIKRSTAEDSRPASRAAEAAKPADSLRDENENLRRDLAQAKADLEKLSRPLHEDISSSTVSATLQPGESLVAGGYQTADGSYEVTFLTPKKVKMDDGRDAVELDAKIVSMAENQLEGTGLSRMATKARNTLQHAEAWSSADVESTLAAAGSTTASPKVIVAPSQTFRIDIGSGEMAYSLEGSVDTAADGSFQVNSRIERKENAGNPFGAPPSEGP